MTSQPDAGSATPDILLGSEAATPHLVIDPEPKPPSSADVTTTYQNQPSYWGIPGEQDLAFLLGLQNWDVVYGPGGEAGKSTFAKGIDYLGVKTGSSGSISLLIPDNKASGVPEPIGKCPALTDNIKTNLDALLGKVTDIPEFPRKTAVIAKLTELRDTINSGGGHVDGVEFSISNAGGYARAPTEGLQQKFFNATNLVNADGTPLRLGFIDTVSPSELAERTALIGQLDGNPRSPTFVSVTKPVILDPARAVLSAEPVGVNMQEAWLGALMIIQLTIQAILGLFPTTAERSLKQLQPELLGKLSSDPSLAGVLLVYVALVENYSAKDLTDTAAAPHPVNSAFVRWEWQYGPSADDAYSWWAAPDKLQPDHSTETPPKHYEQYFWWFDRKTTTPYMQKPQG